MIYRYQSGNQVHEITLERQGDAYQATVDGQGQSVEVIDRQPGQISLRVADKPVTIYFATENGERWLSLGGCTYRLEKPSRRSLSSDHEVAGGQAVRSPMPAQVRGVNVAEGDAVTKGQTLLLLEAMKMEIRIKAPADGRVKRLLAKNGQAVEKDQLLAEIGE
jgi:3-methylcrotonyl-CoA carboxylase alpha subunit